MLGRRGGTRTKLNNAHARRSLACQTGISGDGRYAYRQDNRGRRQSTLKEVAKRFEISCRNPTHTWRFVRNPTGLPKVFARIFTAAARIISLGKNGEHWR
jgi:hypothetical protein